METFHVSTKGQSIDDTEIEERMFGLGPNATDITVQIQDFRPALLDVLGSRLNVITSLEIVNGDWVTSLELHRYLCESPHLLHLKAPRIAIIAEDLYTFSKTLNNADSTVAATEATATAATITGTGQQASGVWACRQLKTLHASFYSRHSFRAGEGGAGLCRHVFGYISRVCPRLSRLEISSMESMWQDDADAYPGKMYSGCMALESGLCLLARLKELRWILLGCNDSDPKVRNVDVSWIFLADETSLARKAERRQIVSSWAVDVETDLKRSQANNSSSSGSRRTEDMESELSERLQNLGTLLDVKRMIDEMDAIDNFECWPLLRGISICRQGGLGQSRRNELRRLLQETKVHDTVSYLPRLFACFPSEWAGG
ncbi:hypothetical protein BGZ95_008021 [Linnemannia exigua]|uniref:Uncharacterized protein n=1 Tax=Linnemannia exigua TaxID=604196 RepID=A0AAD4H7K4_9FUNG|nr:hypothetical protein BGZ95_008021 [Linnemannia exigua]